MLGVKIGGEIVILAGCRRFTLAEAEEHWTEGNETYWTQDTPAWGRERRAAQERSVLSGGRPGEREAPPGFQLGRAPLVLSPRRARLCLLAPLYGCSVGPVPDLSGPAVPLAVLGRSEPAPLVAPS